MKNILITGGAGFIGSRLCEKLFDQGNNITVLDNLEAVKNKLQEAGFEAESSEMIYLAKEKIAPTKEEQLLKLTGDNSPLTNNK